ncbi:hypothetical protein BD779DRAFT_938430 [Infundibulicybe gibba]|nr:hypothetical protein BD779DRAFT_938430 [Infundibulicybe gibba]
MTTSRGRGLQIDLPDSPVSTHHLGSPIGGPGSAIAEMIFNDPFSWHDTHIYEDDDMHNLDVLDWGADDGTVKPFEEFHHKELENADEGVSPNDGNFFPSIWKLKERSLQAPSSGSPSTCSLSPPPSDCSTGPAVSPGSATWSVLQMYHGSPSPDARQPAKRLPKPHTPFLQIPKSHTPNFNSAPNFTSASLPNLPPKSPPSREATTPIRRLPTLPTVVSPSPSSTAPSTTSTISLATPIRRLPLLCPLLRCLRPLSHSPPSLLPSHRRVRRQPLRSRALPPQDRGHSPQWGGLNATPVFLCPYPRIPAHSTGVWGAPRLIHANIVSCNVP